MRRWWKRLWRRPTSVGSGSNRYIAHRDLELALEDEDITPLPAATRIQVTEALASLAAAVNTVQLHFKEGQTTFDHAISSDGALSLLCVLDDGLRAREERLERIKTGKATEEDRQPRRRL